MFGENHPDVAESYNNIGNVFRILNDYVRASEYLQHALDIRKQVFGEAHHYVAESYNNVGAVHHTQGNYDSAR